MDADHWLPALAAGLLIALAGACEHDPGGSCPTCDPGFECVGTTCKKPCADDASCGPEGHCLDGYCAKQCDAAADCPEHDPSCLTGPVRCDNDLCIYPTATPGAPCEPAAGGAGVCVPDTGDVVCLAGCYIDGQGYEGGTMNPANVCELCDAEQSLTTWIVDFGRPCSEGEVTGVCAPPSGGVGPAVCTDEVCTIGGAVYAAGQTHPSNSCERCDPGTDAQTWTPMDQTWCDAGDGADGICVSKLGSSPLCVPCPLGYAEAPIPHCVQPSNWGFWQDDAQGHPVAHDTGGVTLEWIQADLGGSNVLVADNTTVTIATGEGDAPALSIRIGTSYLELDSGRDFRIVPQGDFHGGGALPPPAGVTPAEIPALVAVKLRSISVTGGTTVTCTGRYPVALASQGDVTLGGTWSVRCGGAEIETGGNAAVAADPYASRGGGGGGHAGYGGASGAGISVVNGGAQYGRAELQPLLGGSAGGTGGARKQLDTGLLGAGGLTNPACWFMYALGSYPSDPPATGECGNYSFSDWETNAALPWSWASVTTESPQAGAGGGALQVVSLGKLTLTGQLRAWGGGGESLQGCGQAANLLDAGHYPIKYDDSGWRGCSCPEDASATARSFGSWFLQTGGGGGSGGALLLEAAAVEVASTAVITVEGGGGGAGCYTRGYSEATPGVSICGRAPQPRADPWGYQAGAPHEYFPNMGGGTGAFASDEGDAAPFGTLNPGSDDDPCPAQTLFPSVDVAWGGGGGAAGRVRINTPDGTFTCSGGDCNGAFVPALDAANPCAASSPAQVCVFPDSPALHYRN